MVREAETHAAEDRQRRELVDARNAADQVLYQAEKTLEGLNGQAPADARAKVEAEMAELREAVKGDDTARIKQLSASIQQTLMSIGQAAYTQGQPTTNGQGTTETNPDEDIVEGEFESA